MVLSICHHTTLDTLLIYVVESESKKRNQEIIFEIAFRLVSGSYKGEVISWDFKRGEKCHFIKTNHFNCMKVQWPWILTGYNETRLYNMESKIHMTFRAQSRTSNRTSWNRFPPFTGEKLRKHSRGIH